MAQQTSLDSTDQGRDLRRHADRERLLHAAEQLCSPEGWMRWVLTRATVRGYSAANCMLLAHQCHERGITPQHVCGIYAWRKLGRRVCKGEQALRISAPVKFKVRDDDGRDTGQRRVFFKTAFVFELSQTEELPDADLALQAPELEPEPLNGNTHAHLLVPLRSFAESLGYAVSFGAIDGASGGSCDTVGRRIEIDCRVPVNAQVRALIHECVHALGIDYQRYPRGRAEVIADTVTFLVCASVGLAVDSESIPYVAAWGRGGELEAVTRFAQTIDSLARRVEDAVRPRATPRDLRS